MIDPGRWKLHTTLFVPTRITVSDSHHNLYSWTQPGQRHVLLGSPALHHIRILFFLCESPALKNVHGRFLRKKIKISSQFGPSIHISGYVQSQNSAHPSSSEPPWSIKQPAWKWISLYPFNLYVEEEIPRRHTLKHSHIGEESHCLKCNLHFFPALWPW